MTTQLTINGKSVTAAEGQTLLDVARAADIEIPTLCHHEALEARGACRLCTVELTNPKWPGWKRLVASCVYPAQAGLVVKTSTPEIQELRTVLVDLLLARCPETEAIVALAEQYGIEQTSFERRVEDDRCILCGLCVRACEQGIGAFAIGVSGRGAVKRVGPAYGQPAEACVGCASCAHVCPTGAIPVVDEGGRRTIWNRTFQLERCAACGSPTLPTEQIDHMAGRSKLARAYFELCDDCRRRKTADHWNAVMGR